MLCFYHSETKKIKSDFIVEKLFIFFLFSLIQFIQFYSV